ncbi:MAG: hypothetical protein FD130_2432, partial [Halothiobacillaceae bacterium]
NELQSNFVGEKTALGDAIALAVKRLVQSTPRERVLLLFTDGANTAGRLSPAAALQLAQTQQVRIYTIGVGSHRRVAFPQAILEQPELTTLPFDEALLQQLATATGGRYFAAEESSALVNISAEIDRLERTTRSTAVGATRELYWLLLLLGLTLLYLDHWRQRCHPLFTTAER